MCFNDKVWTKLYLLAFQTLSERLLPARLSGNQNRQGVICSIKFQGHFRREKKIILVKQIKYKVIKVLSKYIQDYVISQP